ncbi:MAG: radical SAM protein [Chloroflexi bacterium]|nr:radical SAM protein [Chloroflexota bacterium]
MNIVLISTYDLGHQPFGLASPAAWLRQVGANVTCLDLSIKMMSRKVIADADLVAFYVPMHTATRLTSTFMPQVQRINPDAHLCCFGLYAPVNEAYLRGLGVHTILGGEFESGLVDLAKRLQTAVSPTQTAPVISLNRQQFIAPNRDGLPPLTKYATVDLGDGTQRTVGYTESSRGCKHLCRHCPVVPVYNGRFFIVQQDIVLADIAQQVAAGAEHITFGDPDFFNGPRHAISIVQQLHEQFPHVTYDVTIKVEHLIKHQQLLPILKGTGCLFITTAVEAMNPHILEIFDKQHTHEEFRQAVYLLRDLGITINPTFVAFTPWTTPEIYVSFLATIAELGLIEHVTPIQLAIRLLIPKGSRLLELPETQQVIAPFDEAALVYPWQHPDPRMDALYEQVFTAVKSYQRDSESRRGVFERVWALATALAPFDGTLKWGEETAVSVPTISEPWY